MEQSGVMNMKKTILVTGGAGYIGSHTTRKLLDDGYNVIVADNLSSGNIDSVDKRAKFYNIDVTDEKEFSLVLENNDIDAVLLLAAKIIVSESVENPYKYFKENVSGLNSTLEVLGKNKIDKIIFASTASIYGNSCFDKKATEDIVPNPINPYAETKLVGERLIYWMSEKYNIDYVIFRYFNVARR